MLQGPFGKEYPVAALWGSKKRIFLPGRTQKNMLARLYLKSLIDVAFMIAQEKLARLYSSKIMLARLYYKV
jgi:hypothetical protein